MTWQAMFCLGLVGSVFAGLILNLAPDALLVGAVVLVTVTGIISPGEAFAGFSNTGMLTVGALYVVAAALRETGALDTIGGWVLGRAKSERSALVRLSVAVTSISAFLNNTPIVAMFIPIITDWCKKHRVAPSKLLLPLSYLAILGGTCTLIGTSTNLVVNGLMIQSVKSQPELAESLHPMGLFELGYVGVPYAIVGILYLVFVGQRMLPSHKDLWAQYSESAREYLVNMRIEPGCRLANKEVEDAGLRHLPGLFLIEIVRQEDLIAPVPPDQVLKAGDILTFTGVANTIADVENIPGLVPVGDEGYESRAAQRRERVLCEAVLSGRAPCVGKSVRDADFRAAYNAAIVAVHRGGERLEGKVGDIVLRLGDTLLLQAGAHFARVNRNNPDFLLVSGVEGARPVRSDKAILSFALLIVLVALMATGVVDIVIAAFLIAGLMVAARCISVADARQSVDWQTLITIAAAFGLGKAFEKSGFVEFVAKHVVDIAGPMGPTVVLAGIYLMTSAFTELITNNAAAALVYPFAVGIGLHLGVSPRPLVFAVTFAASASLITPIGYQTNMMVYGAGGYRLSDFIRVGLPLHVTLLVCATFLIPRVWPF